MVMCDCILSLMIASVHHDVRYRLLEMQSADIWDLRKGNFGKKRVEYRLQSIVQIRKVELLLEEHQNNACSCAD